MSGQAETSDDVLLNYLRRNGPARISDLVAEAGVTATAVRQRIQRLMTEGLIERHAEKIGRGRPNHRYALTAKGETQSGNNFSDLATVLWEEIKSLPDPEVRRGLLKRIADRFVDKYRDTIHGATLDERMSSLAGLMNDREIPFEVNIAGGLPILSALACPYPELAKVDRGVCTMEKLMLSEVLGESMRLSACRLDGANCCTFTPSTS
jgi:DeoR family suf operon transcriptional repressor